MTPVVKQIADQVHEQLHLAREATTIEEMRVHLEDACSCLLPLRTFKKMPENEESMASVLVTLLGKEDRTNSLNIIAFLLGGLAAFGVYADDVAMLMAEVFPSFKSSLDAAQYQEQ